MPQTPARLARRREAQADKLIDLLAQPTLDVRRIAREIIGLRGCYEHDGRPDWAGRSQGYRDEIYRVYKVAGVPSDSLGGLQANLRYHIGNAVRETAPAEDLIALGLDPAGPRERAVRARKEGPKPRRRPGAVPVPEVPSTDDPVALARVALEALVNARRLNGHSPKLAGVLREIIDTSVELLARR